MRKEYGHARSLAIAQAQILQAYDEINMATTRLRLSEDENDKSLDALSEDELPSANVLNTSEKFTSLSLLSCIKGKLRYLKVQSPSLTIHDYIYNSWVSTQVKFRPKAARRMATFVFLY